MKADNISIISRVGDESGGGPDGLLPLRVVTDDDMTVADQPSSRIARRSRADSPPPAAPLLSLPPTPHVPLIDPPQFPLPQRSGPSWLSLFSVERAVTFAKEDAKPDADVVDLLIMNTLDHPAGAASAPAAPQSADSAELLDSLVADHLERATHPSEPAALTEEVEAEEPDRAEGGGAVDGADLLQHEIEALLAGTPSAAAPVEAAHSAVLDEEEIAMQPPLNQAELDVLLAGKTEAMDAPVMAAAEAAAPLPANEPDAEEEAASKMLEAEGVLAEELAQLMAETPMAAPPPAPAPEMQAPVMVEEAVPEPTPVATTPMATASVDGSVETAPAVEAPQPPPGVPEHPIVELAGEVEGDFETEEEVEKRSRRWTGIFSDVALVAAQIADMPFRWIDVLDKNLLGVAAAVLLLSGLVLKLVAVWMGV